jgi:hypothetical protein
MQINGSTLSTAFTPRSSEAREPVRPPIIIDAEPRSRNARPLLPAATETSRFQTALTIDDGQDERQARFVRLFADNNQPETLDFVAEEALPRGVQQYLQIANLDTEPQQRLFDEIV